MAYYSGQVASYQELLDVLVAACIAEGWTWADSILSKGNSFVKLAVQTGTSPGITVQGGTGKSGANLINPSTVQPRLGDLSSNPLNWDDAVFPANYYLHLFEKEVFTILNYSIDRFYYLGFGYTDTYDQSPWISATTKKTTESSDSIYIQSTGGGSDYNTYASASGFFWDSLSNGGVYAHDAICISGIWSGIKGSVSNEGFVSASINLDPLIRRLPSIWNSDSILLPILISKSFSQSKKAIVAEILNARYVRIDHLEPNQVVMLGNDRWKIYPFYKKDINNRDGGTGIRHTGTFGWAIRYDGP